MPNEAMSKHYSNSQHRVLAEFLQDWWLSQKEFRTKNQLARASGIGPMSIGNYFRGTQVPTGNRYERLRRIANLPRVTRAGKQFPVWAEDLERQACAYVVKLPLGKEESRKLRDYVYRIVGSLVDGGVSNLSEIDPKKLLLYPPATTPRARHRGLRFFSRFLIHQGLWTNAQRQELGILLGKSEKAQKREQERTAKFAEYQQNPPSEALPPGEHLRIWLGAQPQYASIAAFARNLGVNVGTVRYWIKGKHLPAGRHLRRVYEVTGLEFFAPSALERLRGGKRTRPDCQKASDEIIAKILARKLPMEKSAKRVGLSVSRFYARAKALGWNAGEFQAQRQDVIRYVVELRHWLREQGEVPTVTQIVQRHVKELRNSKTDLFRRFNSFLPFLERELKERPEIIPQLVSRRKKSAASLMTLSSRVLQRSRAFPLVAGSGRRRKTEEQRRRYQVVQTAKQCLPRFIEGTKILRGLKKIHTDDVDTWRKELLDRRYSKEETDAMLASKTAKAAAQRYTARHWNWTLHSVQSACSALWGASRSPRSQ
jgi:transcriptional regulator with XRE-family HTH domain